MCFCCKGDIGGAQARTGVRTGPRPAGTLRLRWGPRAVPVEIGGFTHTLTLFEIVFHPFCREKHENNRGKCQETGGFAPFYCVEKNLHGIRFSQIRAGALRDRHHTGDET